MMRRNFTSRLLAAVITLCLVVGGTLSPVAAYAPMRAEAAGKPFTNTKSDVRIVVDGTVTTTTAGAAKNDWYVKPDIIKKVLGKKVKATYKGYASLRKAAKSKNVSFTYDGVLNSAYIWTDTPYDAEDTGGDFDRAFTLGLARNDLRKKAD